MSEAQFALGLASLYCGQLSDALAAIDAALLLNPTDTQNFARLATRASALYLLGRYNDAIDTALQSIRLSPKEFSGFRLPFRVLAASYGQLGMDPEAKSAVGELLAGNGTERTIDDVVRPFRRAADREHYTEGLRKAGLPEC
jgi:adenylate cyclase